MMRMLLAVIAVLVAATGALAQPQPIGVQENVTNAPTFSTGEDPQRGVMADEITGQGPLQPGPGGPQLPPFDIKTGNAALEVVIPTLVGFMYQAVSQSGGDASLILYIFALTTNSWFDATAPFHPTAVGVYSRFPRQAAGSDNTAANTALLYASARVLGAVLPNGAQSWAAMLQAASLDPSVTASGDGSPAAIGNAAADGVLQGRRDDGMNWHGYADRQFNPMPFSDWTGYQPKNDPYAEGMSDAGAWKPDIQVLGSGLYKAQVYVTPQWATVEPYAISDTGPYHAPPPYSSNPRNQFGYRRQVDQVLQRSAALNDRLKMQVELFDNKFLSLGVALTTAAENADADLLQFVQIEFLANMATFDAGIVTWQDKTRFDAVRPFSAVPEVYGAQAVRAYAGPNVGTSSSIPADQWRPYQPSADHPEYPSASTCFCNAHANALRLFTGTNQLNYTITYPAGSSRREPGRTPAQDLTLTYATWDDFRLACGASRVDAGVHFEAATTAAPPKCQAIGAAAYQYMIRLIAGQAPQRSPARARRQGATGAQNGGADAPLPPRLEQPSLLCRLTGGLLCRN